MPLNNAATHTVQDLHLCMHIHSIHKVLVMAVVYFCFQAVDVLHTQCISHGYGIFLFQVVDVLHTQRISHGYSVFLFQAVDVLHTQCIFYGYGVFLLQAVDVLHTQCIVMVSVRNCCLSCIPKPVDFMGDQQL